MRTDYPPELALPDANKPYVTFVAMIDIHLGQFTDFDTSQTPHWLLCMAGKSLSAVGGTDPALGGERRGQLLVNMLKAMQNLVDHDEEGADYARRALKAALGEDFSDVPAPALHHALLFLQATAPDAAFGPAEQPDLFRDFRRLTNAAMTL